MWWLLGVGALLLLTRRERCKPRVYYYEKPSEKEVEQQKLLGELAMRRLRIRHLEANLPRAVDTHNWDFKTMCCVVCGAEMVEVVLGKGDKYVHDIDLYNAACCSVAKVTV